MKTGIHPERLAGVVTCATCGSQHPTRWSAGDRTVETCSQCHPAYTGRAARAAGGSRVERFQRRLAHARA